MVTVTLEIQETVLKYVEDIAQRTQRSVETVMSEAVADYVANLPLSELSDDMLMEQVHIMMSDEQQQEMSLLLGKNREGEITEQELKRLDRLVDISREMTLHKAKAIEEAVGRGLIPPINEWTDPVKPPMRQKD